MVITGFDSFSGFFLPRRPSYRHIQRLMDGKWTLTFLYYNYVWTRMGASRRWRSTFWPDLNRLETRTTTTVCKSYFTVNVVSGLHVMIIIIIVKVDGVCIVYTTNAAGSPWYNNNNIYNTLRHNVYTHRVSLSLLLSNCHVSIYFNILYDKL